MYKPTRLISSREPTLQRSQHTGPLMPKNETFKQMHFIRREKVKCSEITLGVEICLIVNQDVVVRFFNKTKDDDDDYDG